MPGTKNRTKRQKKRQPPSKLSRAPKIQPAPPEQPLPSTSATPTTLQRKLDATLDSSDDSSEDDMELECAGESNRLFELQGLPSALTQGACCSVCSTGGLVLKEDLSNSKGLFMTPCYMRIV